MITAISTAMVQITYLIGNEISEFILSLILSLQGAEDAGLVPLHPPDRPC